MNIRTKRVAIIAGVIAVIAIIATVLFVREITIQSNKLSDQIMAIELDQAQQNIFTRISRIDLETQDVRSTLEGFFIESTSGSIDFLNYIESEALASGVELETLAPEEVVKNDVAYLSFSYKVEGSLVRLENFINQLENIPYVSQLQSIDLRQQSSGRWVADITIDVQVLNYEN